MSECIFLVLAWLATAVLTSLNRYETSAAIIETETSTAELAKEVHNRATQAQIAAKEAALVAEVNPSSLRLTWAPG
jgi:hypothetical protein